MINNGRLEQFFCCPQCGAEGFNEDYDFLLNEYYCSQKCWADANLPL